MRFLPLVFLLAAGASAQTVPEVGRIAAVVVDGEFGEPVPGASIMVEELRIGAYSDLDGRAVLDGIPVGEYVVSVRSMGFGLVTRRVVVRSGVTTTVQITLDVVDLGCLADYAEPAMMGRGVYVARVWSYSYAESCESGPGTLYPAFARWEDR